MQMDTPRLRLRRFTHSDVEDFIAYRSDPEVARFQDWEFPLSLESAHRLLRAYSRSDPNAPGWFPYAIEVKADGRVAGDVAVNRRRSGQEADLEFVLSHIDDLETVPVMAQGELIDAIAPARVPFRMPRLQVAIGKLE